MKRCTNAEASKKLIPNDFYLYKPSFAKSFPDRHQCFKVDDTLGAVTLAEEVFFDVKTQIYTSLVLYSDIQEVL